MMNTITIRANKLAAITGGKPEWYSTHAAITKAEAVAGVAWNGNTCEYVKAAPGKLVKSASGNWGRVLHGSHSATTLSRSECVAAGVTPGMGND